MENLDKSLRVLAYYHTSIRNIGLYTSLAFASLVYSRFHRGRTFFINIGLILSSLILTILSTIIGQYLIEDIKTISDDDKSIIPIIDKWLIIPNIMTFINAIILLSTLFVLFNQFS
mgnify:CR=1 FL=1